MFETLFSYPAVLRRHQDGPFATERAAYLECLAAQGTARGTLLRRASCCLCVAREVEFRPADQLFDRGDIESLASAWAAKRTADGRATSRNYVVKIRLAAASWAGSCAARHITRLAT